MKSCGNSRNLQYELNFNPNLVRKKNKTDYPQSGCFEQLFDHFFIRVVVYLIKHFFVGFSTLNNNTMLILFQCVEKETTLKRQYVKEVACFVNNLILVR